MDDKWEEELEKIRIYVKDGVRYNDTDLKKLLQRVYDDVYNEGYDDGRYD